MRTTVPLKDLTLSQPKTELRKPSGYTLTSLSTPKQELDLRGHYQSEAQAMLENYFDSLLITRMPFVRIIHGKGSGRLREMVRNFLKDKLERREIRNFYSPKPEQGGDGVTIIEF
jgi:DNA mismatch repair protein MutS2